MFLFNFGVHLVGDGKNFQKSIKCQKVEFFVRSVVTGIKTIRCLCAFQKVIPSTGELGRSDTWKGGRGGSPQNVRGGGAKIKEGGGV